MTLAVVVADCTNSHTRLSDFDEGVGHSRMHQQRAAQPCRQFCFQKGKGFVRSARRADAFVQGVRTISPNGIERNVPVAEFTSGQSQQRRRGPGTECDAHRNAWLFGSCGVIRCLRTVDQGAGPCHRVVPIRGTIRQDAIAQPENERSCARWQHVLGPHRIGPLRPPEALDQRIERSARVMAKNTHRNCRAGKHASEFRGSAAQTETAPAVTEWAFGGPIP